MKTAQLEDLPHYSYEDYCQWEGDWELINGIPYAMAPSPVITHQMLVARLIVALSETSKHCHQCTAIQSIKIYD